MATSPEPRRGFRLAGLVLLVLAGLGGLFWLGREKEAADVPEPTPAVAVGPRASLPRLAAPKIRADAAIEGQVTGPRGEPFGGARVTAVLRSPEGSFGLVTRPPWSATTESGPDGRYHLGGLKPGVYEIRASAPGYLGHRQAPVELAPAEAESEVNIELRGGVVTLSGRILDPDGKAGGRRASTSLVSGGRACVQARTTPWPGATGVTPSRFCRANTAWW